MLFLAEYRVASRYACIFLVVCFLVSPKLCLHVCNDMNIVRHLIDTFGSYEIKLQHCST